MIFEGYELSAQFKGSVDHFPNTKDHMRHNKFIVSVSSLERCAYNKCRMVETFYYYGSNIDYQNNIIKLDDKELLQAFECFLSDAQAGTMTFKDFCAEFGYETTCPYCGEINKDSEHIWNKCVGAAGTASALHIHPQEDEEEYNRVMDKLRE